jgi:hypothetical protein
MLGWALNEEENIVGYVQRAGEFLAAVSDDFELVLIDDGSTDRTWTLMHSLSALHPWLRLIRNDRNRGSGYCYRTTIAAATKDYCFAQTVDWSYDITELGRSLHLLKQYDILQGVRADTVSWSGLLRRSDTIAKAVVSFVNYGLIWLLFRLPFRDYQNVTVCPTALLHRLDLETDSSFANPEVLIKAWWAGASFAEIPVNFRKRTRGRASGTRVRFILRSVREIVVSWFRWVVLGGVPRRRSGTIARMDRVAAS